MPLAPLLRLLIAFAPAPSLPPAVVAAAVTEAAGIWRPYGVDVRAAGASVDVAATTLTVVADGRSARHAPGVLGAIVFDAESAPRPEIALLVPELVAFTASAHVAGAGASRWPRALHEQILGRVVGRVLAHEIGHFVLGTRGHAALGLMRAALPPDEMAAPDPDRFALAPGDVARLPGAGQLAEGETDRARVQKKRAGTEPALDETRAAATCGRPVASTSAPASGSGCLSTPPQPASPPSRSRRAPGHAPARTG